MVDRYDDLNYALDVANVGDFNLQISNALQYYIRDLENRLIEMNGRITTLTEQVARLKGPG